MIPKTSSSEVKRPRKPDLEMLRSKSMMQHRMVELIAPILEKY
jgi:hypothetical protein